MGSIYQKRHTPSVILILTSFIYCFVNSVTIEVTKLHFIIISRLEN